MEAFDPVKNRRPVWLEGEVVCLLDQRDLPHRLNILRLKQYRETVEAIRQMAVRGAGTIGVTAGYAMAQAALQAPDAGFREAVETAAGVVRAARPTAQNLFYAVDRVLGAVRAAPGPAEAKIAAVREAEAIDDEDVRLTEGIARAGAGLIQEGKAVMTHCNAGWLAYAGWGTALGPLFLAHARGKRFFVYTNETRPRSQGAKLTAWELAQAGIPHALIADTAAGFLFARGEIGLVIVGADRIAANGDTANKIGTYTLAVLARAHEVPFYVAAPRPTFDPACPSGKEIPIEERAEGEVLEVQGVSEGGQPGAVRVAPPGTRALNPAFDVTPARLITGFITERGVIAPTPPALSGYLDPAGTLGSARPPASSIASTTSGK